MDSFEHSEFAYGKELRTTDPSTLFAFIRSKEQELRSKLGQPLAGEIENLAGSLDTYIAHHFTSMPEVVGESRDIYETSQLNNAESSITIEYNARPIVGNDAISKLEQHGVSGRLYGFHRGAHNELRAYIDTGKSPQKLMGGVYQPMMSLGLEHSDLQFVDASVKQNTTFVDAQLEGMNEDIAKVTHTLLDTLINSSLSLTEKLRSVSPLFTEIATNKEINPRFIDALIEIVKYKLRLDLPHTITTKIHRVIISRPPTSGYNQINFETVFEHVATELGIAGETMRPWLGVFFIQDTANGSGPVNIQIPVEYITSIYRADT